MRFLFVDRILHLVPGESIRGIKHITGDDAYLVPDEDGRLCFPSSLIGETLGQLAAWNVMAFNNFSARPVAGVVASASLFRPAFVGDTLLLESFIDCLDEAAVQYHSVARIGDETVFTIDGALGPLLPMNDFIAEDDVRRQFAEINRPGDWPERSSQQDLIMDGDVSQGYSHSAAMTFERILSFDPGTSMIAEKRISRAAPYFPDHFPRNPVLPLTVLLECQLHLAREFLARSSFSRPYRIRSLRKIKMSDFVHPGDVVVCQLHVKQQDDHQLILSFRSEVAGKRVCVLEVVMTAEGSKYE
ncbi:hotdog family protein [Legionella spiritensis]|uniref:(3R)-hydroxymyristoyl-ACP dehydratase n=1 Tax=Legionella spiritensis TaxID=452 RepID=A0A0W0Z1E1_LEGSP|nr:hydroxymyristoyl-ACP dehydratase [Legionella spiritensis]KTD62566.1 (3R)-hydroxymyristoyl-ACP dehydratase [Legionella spiritensis]SNV30621.1 (3R)-hydroxymyristoyl-ACP dehydratase [Legionella spiritensis]